MGHAKLADEIEVRSRTGGSQNQSHRQL